MHEALDGDLGHAATQALMAHLAACPVCSETWARLNGAEALLKRPVLAEPAPGFANRVRVHLEVGRIMRQNSWGWVGLGAATVLMAVLLAIMSSGILSGVSGWISPATWIAYVPIALHHLGDVFKALGEGLWLLIRGLWVFVWLRWGIMCLAATTFIIAGSTLVARSLREAAVRA
jgi:hypothetical protein